jgi:hypothetical protein
LTVLSSDGFDVLVEVKDGSRYHLLHTNGFAGGPAIAVARSLLGLAHLHLPGE